MGCGCGGGGVDTARVVERVTRPNFGSDTGAKWPQLTQPFGFLSIGPESEIDAVIVTNTPVGEVVVSVDAPLVMAVDRPVEIRPFYTNGQADGEGGAGVTARLDVITYDRVPASWTGKRSPRIYARAARALVALASEVEIRVVPVFGARALSVYLENTHASNSLQWRFTGIKLLRAGVNDDEFPISPSGYPTSVPTYNTLAADSLQAFHLDVGTDEFEAVRIYAKSTAGATLVDAWKVRD